MLFDRFSPKNANKIISEDFIKKMKKKKHLEVWALSTFIENFSSFGPETAEMNPFKDWTLCDRKKKEETQRKQHVFTTPLCGSGAIISH